MRERGIPNTTKCEPLSAHQGNRLEEVQGATTSSHIPPPLLQDPWPCIQLHASETWPLTKTNLQRLHCNDRAMIRQICSIKPEDVATVRSSELLAKLQLEDLDLILREREGFAGLGMWSVLVVQSEQHVIYRLKAKGWGRGAGRPKQTWKKLTEKDCYEWKLTTVDPQEMSTWRSGVRSAMRAASQLPGKGPTDVDDAPAPAH